MPLFRFHRGGLAESLATTVIVKNEQELKKLIQEKWRKLLGFTRELKLEILPYPEEGHNLDLRCGWYTQMVKSEQPYVSAVEGFLSEPFQGDINR